MSSPLESVKRHIDRLRELATKNQERPIGAEFTRMADDLVDVFKHIKELERWTTALPQTFGDVSDLPEELLSELSLAKPDELDNQIVTVVNAQGKVASIDQLLVGLFRKFGVLQKRRFLQNRLYRMIKNDMLWSVPDRKGFYTTIPTEGGSETPPDDEDTTEEQEETPVRTRKRKTVVTEDFSRGGDFDDEIPF